MSTIPTLTEQNIRIFVGEQNFQKGQQHVRGGAIVNPEQQAMALKAYCYGSLPEPYRVQVTFDGTGITAALCSCSTGTPTYGNRGCEHAAALLLAWNVQPEAFTHMDDIDTILERQSKAQLITLVKQLLQQQPEVEWQLTMPPLPGHKSVPVDTDEYRRQVDAAFRQAGREWDAVYGISHDLYEITSTAARFARQRDYTNAVAIYEVVALETLSHYLSYHDEDGALGRVVQDCIEGLDACLESEREDEALREQILEAIFAVYRFDVDNGGFGLIKDIPPEFLQDTTPEEKHLAAQWVRTALAELEEKKLESDWRRKRFGGLLLALEADLLSDEEFLRIGRETKSIQEVVTRLLELGRVDEAVQDASQADGWQLLKLADLFVQYEQDSVVERMMYEKAQQERYTMYADWLKNHHLAKNNLAAALEMAELILRRRPWFAEYQKVRELAMQFGSWETVRQGALAFLETTHNTSTLVKIALDEGDIERALQLLQATKSHGLESYQWQYDYSLAPEGALKTAERAEEAYPRASIELYQQHVEHLINGHGRANYQVACTYLVKIRSLYEELDETEQWTTYLAWLRKRHSRLSTLKQELAATGL
ncbi:MAG: SWIM zinc finger domain-containing protein [Ktedonobacteraceae bacterium]